MGGPQRELVDAVMAAVREAALGELAGGSAAKASSVTRAPSRALSRRPSPAAAGQARRTARPSPRAEPSRRIDHVAESEDGAMTITDPAAVLALVASLESGVREEAAVVEAGSQDAPVDPVDEKPESATVQQFELDEPRSEPTRLEVRARPGEEVLRSSAGGAVLRRRSSS